MEEEIDAKFTVADPYYKEMVDLVEQQKNKHKEWVEKERVKKIEVLK